MTTAARSSCGSSAARSSASAVLALVVSASGYGKRSVDLRNQIRERLAEFGNPADGQRAERKPVVRAIVRDEAMLAGREHRGFECGLNRFRAGGRKKRFVQSGGQHAREPFEQLRAHRCRMHVAHAMHERCRLLRDRGGDGGVAVAHARDAEGRGQIDVTVAVHVFHGRAAGGFPENRKVVADVGDVARFVSEQRYGQRVCLRSRNLTANTLEVLVHARAPLSVRP